MKKNDTKKVEETEIVEGEIVEETKEESEKKGLPGWAKLLIGTGIGVVAGTVLGGLFHTELYFEDCNSEDSDDTENDEEETGGDSEEDN